jgi:antitoxin VapB
MKNVRIFPKRAIVRTMITLSHDTEVLARRLADLQGISLEGAIHHALEARARAFGVSNVSRPSPYSPKEIAARVARMNHHAGAIAAMPILDFRAPAAIMDELNAV